MASSAKFLTVPGSDFQPLKSDWTFGSAWTCSGHPMLPQENEPCWEQHPTIVNSQSKPPSQASEHESTPSADSRGSLWQTPRKLFLSRAHLLNFADSPANGVTESNGENRLEVGQTEFAPRSGVWPGHGHDRPMPDRDQSGIQSPRCHLSGGRTPGNNLAGWQSPADGGTSTGARVTRAHGRQPSFPAWCTAVPVRGSPSPLPDHDIPLPPLAPLNPPSPSSFPSSGNLRWKSQPRL